MMAMTSLGLLAGGVALQIGDNVLRDDEGYLMSSTKTYASPGFAVTSQSIDLRQRLARTSTCASRWLGTVRVEAQSRAADGVFVGIAPTSDVDAYLPGRRPLDGHRPRRATDGRPETTYVDGTHRRAAARRTRPSGSASAQGSGSRTLTWEPEDGDWTIVVMNADGTAPVRPRVSAGAEVPVLDDVVIVLLVAGVVLLALSVLVLVLAIRRRPAA